MSLLNSEDANISLSVLLEENLRARTPPLLIYVNFLIYFKCLVRQYNPLEQDWHAYAMRMGYTYVPNENGQKKNSKFNEQLTKRPV